MLLCRYLISGYLELWGAVVAGSREYPSSFLGAREAALAVNCAGGLLLCLALIHIPEGPSTQHFRFLVQKTMRGMGMVFGTRDLRYWML